MFLKEREYEELGEDNMVNKVKSLLLDMQNSITERNELLGKIFNMKDTSKDIKTLITDSKLIKIATQKQRVNYY